LKMASMRVPAVKRDGNCPERTVTMSFRYSSAEVYAEVRGVVNE
jgi:hypothetical protein